MDGREYLHWMMKISVMLLAAETERCPNSRVSVSKWASDVLPATRFILLPLVWARHSSDSVAALLFQPAMPFPHSETQTPKNVACLSTDPSGVCVRDARRELTSG